MRTPQIGRILNEEMPKEHQGWLSKLINPLNSFINSLQVGLNKGLSVNENLRGELKKITLIGTSLDIAYSVGGNPVFVSVGYIYNFTDNKQEVSGVTWSYNPSSKVLSVTFPSLSSGKKYSVTLLILED